MSFGGVDEKKLAEAGADEVVNRILPDAELRIRRIIADLKRCPLRVQGKIGGVDVDVTIQLLGDQS